MKLTELKGCGKELITIVEHSEVWWRREGNAWTYVFGKGYVKNPPRPRTMMATRAHTSNHTRKCGDYQRGWRARTFLCEDCIVLNGLKW